MPVPFATIYFAPLTLLINVELCIELKYASSLRSVIRSRYRDAFLGITFSVPAVGDLIPVCLAPSDSDDEDSDASIVHLGWEYTPLKQPNYKTKKRGRPRISRFPSSGGLNNTSANVPLNPH